MGASAPALKGRDMEKYKQHKKDIFLLDGIEYTEVMINSFDKERLLKLNAAIMANIKDIKAQLATARGDYAANGISADWEWVKKAEGAKRIMAEWLEKVNAATRERKAMKVITFERMFVDKAKEVLSTIRYREIEDEAVKAMRELGWDT